MKTNGRRSSGCRRAGFTIVELLVVITVVALLMTVLLPSLTRARELAWRTKCGAATRELDKACQVYQSDFNGYIPSGDNSGNTSNGVQYYLNGEYRNTGASLANTGDYTTQSLYTNKGCPFAPATYSTATGNTAYSPPPGTVGVGVNGQLQNGIAWKNGAYAYVGQYNDKQKRTSKHPEMVMVSSCSITAQASTLNHALGVGDQYQTTAALLPGRRHNGEGLPMTFYDGHGEFVPITSMYVLNPAPAPGAALSLPTPGNYPYTMMTWSFYTYGYSTIGANLDN